MIFNHLNWNPPPSVAATELQLSCVLHIDATFNAIFSETRLHDLNGLVNLLHQIGNFKSKVMGANALIENVFRECIKACANTTYTYIFNNCNQLHAREFGEDQKVISDPYVIKN